MVRNYVRRSPYKYSVKQMDYWKRKSKNQKYIDKWNLKLESLKRKIRKELEQEALEDERRKEILMWTEKQELKIGKDIYNKVLVERTQEKAKRQQAQINRSLRNSKDIMSYLKKENVASINRNLSDIIGNTKGTYDLLLNDALTNPKDFKELIIEEMDKIKHLLEVRMVFKSYINKTAIDQADITIRNHTIDEILVKMEESGIKLGEIMDSNMFKDFRSRLGQTSGSYQDADSTLVNVDVTISLRRGKV